MNNYYRDVEQEEENIFRVCDVFLFRFQIAFQLDKSLNR